MLRSFTIVICIAFTLYSRIGIAEENCLLDSCATKDTTPNELNLLDSTLQPCSSTPMTGFYRDSFCRTGADDRGVHVVCAQMTATFLDYTKSQGNDLSSPAPQYGFPGLNPGDQWCLCADRWLEAHKENAAPTVVADSTSQVALETIPLGLLLSAPPKQ